MRFITLHNPVGQSIVIRAQRVRQASGFHFRIIKFEGTNAVACKNEGNAMRNIIIKISWLSVFVLGLGFVIHRISEPSRSYLLYDELLSATSRDDLTGIKLALAKGADVNGKPFSIEDGDTAVSPLVVAARSGSLTATKYLLSKGADPSLCDAFGTTPLVAATRHDNNDILLLLIQHGAVVNDDAGGSSALWAAAVDGHIDATRTLLNHGANPLTSYRISNNKYKTVHEIAVESEHVEVAKIIDQKVSNNRLK